MMEPLVLVVDDEPEMASVVAEELRAGGYRSEVAMGGRDALVIQRKHVFDAVVSDVRMSGIDGVELLKRLRDVEPTLPVILMTGDATVASAVSAMQQGAFHYMVKPFEAARLCGVVRDAVLAHPRREPVPSVDTLETRGTEALLGESLSMQALRTRVQLVGDASSPVLVVGETGTGKELVSHAIHACSARRSCPFVTVNTAAIPEALLESEMFGHVRGAFTGATQNHRGLLLEADGGTLLLDEIGDMPLGLQSKLLRVLQTGEIRPVGSDRVHRVDVRIIAATHRNLPRLIKEGRFREDLYYRLNVISILVPPLRARATDVPLLAERFLVEARARAPNSPVKSISPALLAKLSEGSWPGNVRELQSALERLVVLGRVEVLELCDFMLAEGEQPASSESSPVVVSSDGGSYEVDEVIRRHVESVLETESGNRARAAKLLGIDLSTLYRWQQKWHH